MDRLNDERRSWNMSRIRSGNTKPEIVVRKCLHSLGFRFRLNRHDIPGKPDIVIPKHNTVVSVHGCFWHRHEGCQYAYTPKSNVDFWMKKFHANVKRDRVVSEQLSARGWRQLIIWECQTRDPKGLTRILKAFFRLGDTVADE